MSNTNSFNAKCSKHAANAIKKRKIPASKGLPSSLPTSSKSFVKHAPPKAAYKSSQGLLPPAKKPASKETQSINLMLGTPRLKHYQDSPAHDIDKRDANDPLSVTEYVQDMYVYYREQESRAVVDPMKDQQEINERMRSILVDWLIEVHLKSKLEPETLYITINIIDRYLSVAKATRKTLQLIGCCALLIASKYEEIYPIDIDDLIYVCDRAYSRAEVR